jgi:hypothetical protein
MVATVSEETITSTFKIEVEVKISVIRSPETLKTTYETIQRHNLEYYNPREIN